VSDLLTSGAVDLHYRIDQWSEQSAERLAKLLPVVPGGDLAIADVFIEALALCAEGGAGVGRGGRDRLNEDQGPRLP
jgi:hypothetical protein